MKNVVGSTIAVIAIALLLFVTPQYYIGLTQWTRSQSEALSYTRELIDTVIDTRQLTEDMLNDYSLSLSSTTEYYKYTITRKVKCVMPDPKTPGQTYSTYIDVDDITQFNQGDRIIVEVKPVGVNSAQLISTALLGTTDVSDRFRLVGRVR